MPLDPLPPDQSCNPSQAHHRSEGRRRALVPLPPLLRAHSAQPISHVEQSISRQESPSANQDPRPGGEPAHATAFLWPRHSARVSPTNSSSLLDAATRQEVEEEAEVPSQPSTFHSSRSDEPPRGPQGARILTLNSFPYP